jgi:hypothetical protein
MISEVVFRCRYYLNLTFKVDIFLHENRTKLDLNVEFHLIVGLVSLCLENGG